jgi:hypothetical protein
MECKNTASLPCVQFAEEGKGERGEKPIKCDDILHEPRDPTLLRRHTHLCGRYDQM